MELEDRQYGKFYNIINVYALVDDKEKREFQESMVSLKIKINSKIIIVAGDFNIVLLQDQKRRETWFEMLQEKMWKT